MDTTQKQQLQKAWGLISLFAILHIFLAATLGLGYDETYYWQWTKHLDLGYFDHPPMVAYFIWITTKLLGSDPLFVRFANIITNIVVSSIIYHLVVKITKKPNSGLIGVLVFNLLPIFAIGQLLITPDTPQLFFYSLAFYLSYKILEEDNGSLLNWIFLGIFFGCSLLSKYTAIFLVGIFYLSLLINPKYRKWAKSYKSYLSLVLTFVTFAPNLYWNAKHGWATFVFQFYSRHSDKVNHVGSFFSFFGMQFVATGIIFLVLFILAAKRYYKQYKMDIVFISGIIPLATFTLLAMIIKVRFYWAVLSFVPLSIMFAVYWENYKTAMKYGITLCSLVMAIIFIHLHYPLYIIKNPQKDPYGDIHGWNDFAATVNGFMYTTDNINDWSIITNDFHIAASVDYSLLDKYPVYSLPAGDKLEGNQYWQNESALIGKNALIVVDSVRSFDPYTSFNCKTITPYKTVTVIHNNILFRELALYSCIDYQGRK